SDRGSESTDFRNLAVLELSAGHFRLALTYSTCALSLAAKAEDESQTVFSLVSRAVPRFALGDVAAALADFKSATELQREPLYSWPGITEAECKLLRGDRSGAHIQTEA